jgi:hypothetical protein
MYEAICSYLYIQVCVCVCVYVCFRYMNKKKNIKTHEPTCIIHMNVCCVDADVC